MYCRAHAKRALFLRLFFRPGCNARAHTELSLALTLITLDLFGVSSQEDVLRDDRTDGRISGPRWTTNCHIFSGHLFPVVTFTCHLNFTRVDQVVAPFDRPPCGQKGRIKITVRRISARSASRPTLISQNIQSVFNESSQSKSVISRDDETLGESIRPARCH